MRALLVGLGIVGLIVISLVISGESEEGQSKELASMTGKEAMQQGLLTAEDEGRLTRWLERSEVHNPNLIAVEMKLRSVGEDRVIDGDEHDYLCSVHAQWERQLGDLLDYVAEYEQVEPEFVLKNQAMFTAWERDARKAQEVVLEIGPTCP